jgi:hypothetical protein
MTSIVRIALTHNQSGFLATITQLHHAVMSKGQPFRKITHRRHRSPGRTRYLQQELMLLRCEAHASRSFFAKVQELSQCEAKLSKCANGRLKRIIAFNLFMFLHFSYRSTIRKDEKEALQISAVTDSLIGSACCLFGMYTVENPTLRELCNRRDTYRTGRSVLVGKRHVFEWKLCIGAGWV